MPGTPFDLQGLRWTPTTIPELRGALVEFPDVFSKFSTDFVSCSLCLFKASVRPTAPWLHLARISLTILSPPSYVDSVWYQYIATGLIPHSTSPLPLPFVMEL